jgi:UDPglucose 6-dehydrogenase
MRDAPSLVLIRRLQEAGAEVAAFDPVGVEQAGPMLPGVTFTDDAYSVAKDADALVLVTEWDEFRGLDLKRLAAGMRGRHLIDLRNVYDPEDAEKAKLSYRGVGRGEKRATC